MKPLYGHNPLCKAEVKDTSSENKYINLNNYPNHVEVLLVCDFIPALEIWGP